MLVACLVALGAITVDKVVGVLVYWSLFPIVINTYGICKGVPVLFLLQVGASVVFLCIYDEIHAKDLLKIGEISSFISRQWAKVKNNFTDREVLLPPKVSWLIKLVLLSWQFSPPIVLLFLRAERNGVRNGTGNGAGNGNGGGLDDGSREGVFQIKGNRVAHKDLLIILMSALISTAWWVLYSLVIIKLKCAYFN